MTLEDNALNQIFRAARTHSGWLDKPVSDELLEQLYDLLKWGLIIAARALGSDCGPMSGFEREGR